MKQCICSSSSSLLKLLGSYILVANILFLTLILFNLGYLPGGNKSITTNHKIVINVVKKGLNMLNNKGIILVVCYPHKEGKKESKTLLKYLDDNKITYKIYKNTDNINAPFLIKIN